MGLKASRQDSAKYAVWILLLSVFPSAYGLHFRKTEVNLDAPIGNNAIDYKTLEFEVPVDHFSFANQDKFKLRYLLADQFWDHKNGPVFFYTGNEGDITWFCNNTGFMWDIAPEFKALLVFAEHRYYGTSLPYGQDSYKDIEHLGYLSSEQALADFVALIAHLRGSNETLTEVPFIAFGGSYGGMLSAWLRMKYPHAVQGSLAASAPVWYFGDLTPCDSFSRITTADFARESPSCSENIRKSWGLITDMGKTESGRRSLTETFKLCKPLKTEEDVSVLKSWLSDTYGNLAMVNYPYAASFLAPLPAWPVREACTHLSRDLEAESLLVGVASAVGVYYNFTGHALCYNTSQQAGASLGDMGWSFQACSEMVMPMCSNGESDMFEPSPWNLTAVTAECVSQWGVTPRPQAALNEYGGRDIRAASNIIFSNGKLDPWSGAGVLTSLSPSLVAIVIAEGAHHLDLRSANPNDPPGVVAARAQEKAIIRRWITEFTQGRRNLALHGHLTSTNIIIQHTTSGTHAAVFGVFALVVCAAAGLVFMKWRSPPKVKVIRCSVAPLWTEVETRPDEESTSGLQYVSTESLRTSEKSPLLS